MENYNFFWIFKRKLFHKFVTHIVLEHRNLKIRWHIIVSKVFLKLEIFQNDKLDINRHFFVPKMLKEHECYLRSFLNYTKLHIKIYFLNWYNILSISSSEIEIDYVARSMLKILPRFETFILISRKFQYSIYRILSVYTATRIFSYG